MNTSKISRFIFTPSILILSAYYFNLFSFRIEVAYIAVFLYVLSLILSFKTYPVSGLIGENLVLGVVGLALVAVLILKKNDPILTSITLIVVLFNILLNVFKLLKQAKNSQV